MYDLFSSYDATEVIKKWKIRSYRLRSYLMFGVFSLLMLEVLIITFFLSEEETMLIYLLILVSLIFVGTAIVYIQKGNQISSGQKTILEVELFNNYPTHQTKIPIVKRSQNKSNAEAAMILLLGSDVIEVIQLNRGLKKTASYETQKAVFKFYIDTSKGQEKTQRKFYIDNQRAKHTFYMIHDTEFKIMKHIMASGYRYEIYENKILKKQFR
jgi:hypothetical protein